MIMKPSDTFHPGILKCLVLSGCFAAVPSLTGAEDRLRFDFSPDRDIPEATTVAPVIRYDAERGFGFLNAPGADPDAARLFAVAIGEGNYDVSVRLGSESAATSTTVKAEARRLMLRDVETAPGEFVTRTFTVNVRVPGFGESEEVNLKSREEGPPLIPSWDDRLSFEFNGDKPGVVAMDIRPNPEATTVFLAGDSTVTDQRNEPWAGWGQMLPSFFKPGVAISNHAASGLSLASFEYQHRLKKVLTMMKEGDYLFIQFGHNDQKDDRPGAGPFTTYKENLEGYVDAARGKGGKPVLVTPMERRRWSGGKPGTTLADYAAAVRLVGEEKDVPVIDLHAMSLTLYEALGQEGSKKAFVFYPANTWPDQEEALSDNTHHSPYGGYELARCVVEGIRSELPELARFLVDDAGGFDPAAPDAPGVVEILPSPRRGENDTPDGS